nr:flagellar brake protein [Cronobacter malonaticus]
MKQNPLAVLGILRDLQKSQAPIRLSWGGWQFISRILDASPEQLVLDFGSQASENQAVQKAKNIQFSAEAQGAKVEFNLPALNVGEFQDLPAFVAPLPEAVWFVQRREHFRITAPVQPQFYSLARMPDGKLFRGRLQDLSLGGMGTLLEGTLPEGLEAGMQFSPLELDLLEWGKFRVDAQLLTISERKVVDSKNETIATPRLSFRFMNVSPGTERELQRIIFALERIAREKASRVR